VCASGGPAAVTWRAPGSSSSTETHRHVDSQTRNRVEARRPSENMAPPFVQRGRRGPDRGPDCVGYRKWATIATVGEKGRAISGPQRPERRFLGVLLTLLV